VTVSLEKITSVGQINSPTTHFMRHSQLFLDNTTKRFPSRRASTIQIVCPFGTDGMPLVLRAPLKLARLPACSLLPSSFTFYVAPPGRSIETRSPPGLLAPTLVAPASPGQRLAVESSDPSMLATPPAQLTHSLLAAASGGRILSEWPRRTERFGWATWPVKPWGNGPAQREAA